MPSITSVLVANRGEIARRVFATCRKLGLGTVAVYSDADADSPHVSEADAAVHLPGTSSAETYLRGELIIAAAKATGADAIHPGYGFLSENADFARAVADAGLTWIGPPVAAIESMGSKIESKKLMDAAGVPVLGQLDPETVTTAQLPVLVKASAGGGGRGMRIVSELDKLPAEIAAAQREAQSAFGDPTVFCERYLGTGRHIEVQVMADAHGTVWAVGERECSIQRRHQKVIEEAPSPLVTRVDGMRERLFEASRTAAAAIGYVGAGTMEFLATEDGEFFFLEMNTRLQVEHPVTECTTGLDLVALQIQVADGGTLPAEPPAIQGHSIEARLYAENPAAGWQPQSGTVRRFDIPGATAEFHLPGHPGRNGVRLDSMIETGATVTTAQLPVLVKASAGGGGRGMRIVSELDKLPAEIAAAQREAQSAFGDPTVFCERYLGTGRHIEVQVMADAHGTVWAVGERECSIQRRHQKVIEEAPSPLVTRIDGMRERLFQASRTAAAAIGYVGAGTMEFLATEDGEFFFLEMNTRLQVEHPVTECTTGLDLVALQIQVADGGTLPAEPPAIQGHSIEARLYAENPAAGWQPQSGTVRRFDIPGATAEFHLPGHPGRNGVRLDSMIETGAEVEGRPLRGSTVSVHYDPMLAKVITVAPTRTEAARLLASTLERARIHGLTTNRDLLVNVLRHPAFLDGDTDTSFLDKHGLDTLARPLADEAAHQYSALAAALADAAANRAAAVACAAVPSGWRNLRGPSSGFQTKEFVAGDSTVRVRYRLTRTGLELDGASDTAWPTIELVSATPEHVALVIDGVRRGFDVANYGDTVDIDSPLGPVALTVVPRFTDPSTEVAAGSLIAPMPGVVLRLGAAVGDAVTAGTPIVWLEAMKMEHTIVAPADGVVEILNVEPGQQVELGTVLAQLAAEATTEGEPA
ncbi:Probable acetyl-/propionyl-CoA carboxylase alpha subunit AccA2 [Mycobacteroides abscessus subsp. abscessus]|nr:Probable acetyl-/propionyl-CoA carboxylase alpha subunit AccA2 [Mycobacteroides abscessus subsp. abscessus]